MIVAKIYPNGEFSCGEYHPKRLERQRIQLLVRKKRNRQTGVIKSTKSDYRDCLCGYSEMEVGKQVRWNDETWDVIELSRRWIRLSLSRNPSITWELSYPVSKWRSKEITSVKPSPLGLSLVSKSSQAPRPRGSKGISSYSRRQIRNVCHVLENEFGKRRLSFLTLTVPEPENEEEQGRYVSNWSKLVSQITNWLRKRLAREGLPTDYVLCTEIQVKRYAKSGTFAPHLHIVFVGRSAGWDTPWAITPEDAREAWSRCLQRHCLYRPFNASALENLQGIHTSAGAYLSKYMSKGVSKSGKTSDSATAEPGGIRCWTSYSRRLGRVVSRAICRIGNSSANGHIARALLERVAELSELDVLAYGREFEIYLSRSDIPERSAGPPMLLGSAGRIKLDGRHINWTKLSEACASVLVGVSA